MDKKKCLILLILLFFCCLPQALAQWSVSAQLRARSEYRNGQGTPRVQDTVPAFFVSQRSRVNLAYTGYRFKIYSAVQDVRVWGQDASSVNRTTAEPYDGLMLHEAWAEISLVDTGKVIKNFTLKIGRQELVYDDVRLLGNLDWLQQARRHDAALIKFGHNGWTVHLGAAYNQNAERKAGTVYNGVPASYSAGTNGMATLYKSMQFLYVAKKMPFGNTSFLAFKDDFSKFRFAPADVEKKTPIYLASTWSRHTIGVNMSGKALRDIMFAASAFYQGGRYREGSTLNEYLLSCSASYAVSPGFSAGSGFDITSGNNGADPSKRFQRFDPLYGTPHKFWGYMDYFYVADGFGANGLVDYYLKTKYKPKDHFTLGLDAHQFVLPAAVTGNDGRQLSKKLGTEIDFVFNYNLTKAISIEGGYAVMFSTETMSSVRVKNLDKASNFSDWAYLMVSIKTIE